MNMSNAFCSATSHKGGVEQGERRGPAVKFPILKFFRTGYREGTYGGQVKAWDP